MKVWTRFAGVAGIAYRTDQVSGSYPLPFRYHLSMQVSVVDQPAVAEFEPDLAAAVAAFLYAVHGTVRYRKHGGAAVSAYIYTFVTAEASGTGIAES